MPLTEAQERKAAEAAERLESLDPDSLDPSEWKEAGPLRTIAAADDAVEHAHQRLADAVTAAHDAGFSWTSIATVLGVSRQAARQRFGKPARA